MQTVIHILVFIHVMSFVFMSVPLFNLIVVNERALLGKEFNAGTDNYMDNIIRHGAYRCFVFQFTILISGLLLLEFGPLGFEALWTNGPILIKTIILFSLMIMLSAVHFNIQPKIDKLIGLINAGGDSIDDLLSQLKPIRVLRKRMATFCLFLVITTIIFGMQVYESYDPILTISLIIMAGLFALRVNKTLIRFGWI